MLRLGNSVRVRTLLTALMVWILAGCTAVDDREYRTCVMTMTAVGTGAGVASGSGAGALGGAAVGSAAALTLCGEPQDSESLEPPVIAAGTVPTMLSDADGDGVDDGDDRCRETPAGTEVNELGCPRPLVLDGRLLNFEYDSADLPGDAEQVLEPAVAFISEHPRAVIMIVGHTDSRGTDEYNDDLSLRRARSVRDALIRLGVPAGRMEVSGRGEREPVATNETEAGKARNRRVEVSVKPTDGDA